MRYACGVSGSGSNYEKIFERNPQAAHIVFSNAPRCAGVAKAQRNGAPLALLDSARYFGDMWGLGKVPRNGVERDAYDMAIMTLKGCRAGPASSASRAMICG
jgi:folate-dependent phosphoribosylglycinamide formyltransferase PurN